MQARPEREKHQTLGQRAIIDPGGEGRADFLVERDRGVRRRHQQEINRAECRREPDQAEQRGRRRATQAVAKNKGGEQNDAVEHHAQRVVRHGEPHQRAAHQRNHGRRRAAKGLEAQEHAQPQHHHGGIRFLHGECEKVHVGHGEGGGAKEADGLRKTVAPQKKEQKRRRARAAQGGKNGQPAMGRQARDVGHESPAGHGQGVVAHAGGQPAFAVVVVQQEDGELRRIAPQRRSRAAADEQGGERGEDRQRDQGVGNEPAWPRRRRRFGRGAIRAQGRNGRIHERCPWNPGSLANRVGFVVAGRRPAGSWGYLNIVPRISSNRRPASSPLPHARPFRNDQARPSRTCPDSDSKWHAVRVAMCASDVSNANEWLCRPLLRQESTDA